MFEFQTIQVIEEQRRDRLARATKRKAYIQRQSSQQHRWVQLTFKLSQIRHWLGRNLISLGERMLIQDTVCEPQKGVRALRS